MAYPEEPGPGPAEDVAASTEQLRAARARLAELAGLARRTDRSLRSQ
jgi:hypothetical protein